MKGWFGSELPLGRTMEPHVREGAKLPFPGLSLRRLPQDRERVYEKVRVTSTCRPQGLTVPRHTHDLTCIAFSLSGRFDETIGRDWHSVGADAIVIRPGGVPHSNRYRDPETARVLVLELLPAALNDVRSHTRAFDQPHLLERTRLAAFGPRIEAESQQLDSASSLAMEALVLDLAASVARARHRRSPSQPPWMPRVEDFLRSEFARSVSLGEIAAAAGVHPAHLARTFRVARGVSIGQYLRRLRIAQGVRLLASGDRTMSEVAAACGFYDQSHFTRVFRQHYGVPPGQYARRLRG